MSDIDKTAVRDAATVIVLRDPDRPHVLMGQRGKTAAFMPDKFVFPGGAVDAAYLANKVLLGGHFAITRGMSDVEDAALLMQGFDGSATSTQAGFDQTDAVYADILSGADDGFLMQLVGIADTPLV